MIDSISAWSLSFSISALAMRSTIRSTFGSGDVYALARDLTGILGGVMGFSDEMDPSRIGLRGIWNDMDE
jgi:hypothetical protein